MDNINLTIRNEEDYIPTSFYRDGNLRFDPLCYEQRYLGVLRLLESPIWNNKIKKVVDFGCSEIKFFNILKTCKSIEKIIAVDINEDLLNIHGPKVAPLLCDYLNPRNKPFTVEVYCGSVCDPDECLVNCDAVVGIELIEHLFPNELENLPFNLFSFIKPKLIILTTPNSEFNVLFEGLQNGGFRHDDHKFEWTRAQFEDWSNNLCERYPDYKVKFFGIGAGPKDTEKFGCCSQLAIFVRQDILSTETVANEIITENIIDNEAIVDKPITTSCEYKLIAKYVYPIYIDNRTRDAKILDELKYHVGRLMNSEEKYYNYSKWHYEIPFEELSECVVTNTETKEDMRRVLIANSYEIDDGDFIIIKDESIDDELDQFNNSPINLDIDEDV